MLRRKPPAKATSPPRGHLSLEQVSAPFLVEGELWGRLLAMMHEFLHLESLWRVKSELFNPESQPGWVELLL